MADSFSEIENPVSLATVALDPIREGGDSLLQRLKLTCPVLSRASMQIVELQTSHVTPAFVDESLHDGTPMRFSFVLDAVDRNDASRDVRLDLTPRWLRLRVADCPCCSGDSLGQAFAPDS